MICCQHLDDYLCEDLADADRLAFEAQLASCQACAEAVEAERRLMNRLRVASETLEHPARTLPIPESAPRAAANSRLALSVTLAALVLLITVVVPSPVAELDKRVVATPLDNEIVPPSVQLQPGLAAVSIPSGDPNIRILMVFAEAKPSTSQQPALVAHADIP